MPPPLRDLANPGIETASLICPSAGRRVLDHFIVTLESSSGEVSAPQTLGPSPTLSLESSFTHQWMDTSLKTTAGLYPANPGPPINRPDPVLRLAVPWTCPTSTPKQDLGTPRTSQPTVSGTAIWHQLWRPLGPAIRPQDLALPACRLSLASGSGFTHKWMGNSPWGLWLESTHHWTSASSGAHW